jgi:predicted transcriptional regulator
MNERNCDILISVKPERSRKIFSGEKIVELRKSAWDFEEMKGRKVYVYESAPTKKIVGYWISDRFCRMKIDTMIKIGVHLSACISVSELRRYFKNNFDGLYIFCDDNFRLPEPVDPWKVEGFRPPQSWMYLTKEMKRRFGL